MSHLGSFSGTGTLVVGDTRTPVEYEIHELEGLGGLKSAQGTIEGDIRALVEAYDARSSTLEFADGRKAKVLIKHLDYGGFAEIVVSGPIA